jgi:hypothetical protein
MRDPDIKATHGKAWMATLTEEQKREAPAHLAMWLMHCPGAHPFWSWYVVALVSLRDIEGQPPAHKQYPGAEHEMLIVAINPDKALNPDVPMEWLPARLEPANLVAQFDGVSDKDASRLTTWMVEAFCHGRISPDTDYRRLQLQAIAGTLAHLKAGHHVEH